MPERDLAVQFEPRSGESWREGLDEVAPMVFLDPPDHTAFRRLVASGFTPRRVNDIEPTVRAFVRARIDRLVGQGSGDVVAELLKPLPSFVVAHYLGAPDDDRDRFDGWTQGIVAANALGDPLRAGTTVAELFGYFTELIERRRREPGADAVSQLVEASATGSACRRCRSSASRSRWSPAATTPQRDS